MSIVFARLFSLGLILGLSFPLSSGLLPGATAHAAQTGWSARSVQHRWAQFRPWSRTESKSAPIQRQSQMRSRSARPEGLSSGRRGGVYGNSGQRQQAVLSDQRSGARKAQPITRGQELGLRFRPDDRETPYAHSLMPQAGGVNGPVSEELMSQFRPLPRKHRPTYEELQAETVPQSPAPMVPAMPYPMLPQPPSPYPHVYPPW